MTYILDYPRWSDLGIDPGTIVIEDWDSMLQRLQQWHYYYEGLVFSEEVPSETLPNPTTEPPLLFPLGLNLVKMLCIAQADSMFGEWDDQPVQFTIKNNAEMEPPDEEALTVANEILDFSNAGSMFWELEIDRNLYGGGAIKISPTLDGYPYIKWSRVPRNGFFPIWDPADPENLLEVYYITPMTPSQAFAKYGLKSQKDIIYRVEHWTRGTFKTILDNIEISAYSGMNPWGVVPFAYIPRFRVNRWWGESLTQDIIAPQDELNMRVADTGEAISYNSHPVRWGLNMPKSFNAENYPIMPNSFWDMGRAIDRDRAPQVGMLEAKAAVSDGVFDYINFIYDWSRTTSNSPPIAFGEDNGGGQRSGITLEIRMWPLLRAIRRSRGFLTTGIKRALMISGRILDQKEFPDIGKRAIQRFLKNEIAVSYYPVLPRDQQAIVDEVIKLLGTDPPGISIETAQKELGRGPGEVVKIKSMLENKDLWKKEKEWSSQAKQSSPQPAQPSS